MFFRLPKSQPAKTPPAIASRRRPWGATATLLFLLLPSHRGVAADAGLLHLRCTNPVSGTNWPVVVDFEHRRVDSLPATISDKRISWHDPKQGFFDYERATGKLEFRNASSTGGYFLHFECRPD